MNINITSENFTLNFVNDELYIELKFKNREYTLNSQPQTFGIGGLFK